MDVSERHLSAVKNGKTPLSSKLYKNLCETLGVPIDFFSLDGISKAPDFVLMDGNSVVVGEVKRSAAPFPRLKIHTFDQPNPLDNTDYFPVPFREARGGMGGGSCVGSKAINSYISLKKEYLFSRTSRLDQLSFIHADGDSMEPTIPPDAAVLIDESQTQPLNGKIYYIFLNGEYYIKRLLVSAGKVTAIQSDNGPHIKEITEADTIQIIGRALLQMGNL